MELTNQEKADYESIENKLIEEEIKREQFLRFDIVAFEVPKHKSLIYKRFLSEEQLLKAISEAISKNANVISIRRVENEKQRTRN